MLGKDSQNALGKVKTDCCHNLNFANISGVFLAWLRAVLTLVQPQQFLATFQHNSCQ
uniref:Uncharacterized protein n=1 Tax=Romanomermis culicivorax TaxID=13658 RepID=A0A915IRW2_ROMCU